MHTDGDKLMTLVTSMGFSIKESIILKVYIKVKFWIYYYIFLRQDIQNKAAHSTLAYVCIKNI